MRERKPRHIVNCAARSPSRSSLQVIAGIVFVLVVVLAPVLAPVLAAGSAEARATPSVVVTLKPIHSLVAAVMAGVGEPVLLVKGAGSPHAYALRPSDARALGHADLLFQVSDRLEVFLQRTRRGLPKSVKVISLIKAPGLELVKLREHDQFIKIGADPAAGKKHGTTTPFHDQKQIDTHVWLDPRNAIAMTAHIAKVLANIYPASAARFRANAKALDARLRRLDAQLLRSLKPYAKRPYIVFHDAYHYFEQRYNLATIAAISLSPEQRPGARTISRLRAMIKTAQAKCLFTEPQFQPRLARTLIEGTATKLAVLDPLGAALPPGPQLYETLLGQMASSLRRCLN